MKKYKRGSKRKGFTHDRCSYSIKYAVISIRYLYLYVSLMVTTKQKPTIDTQKKRRESKHTTLKIINSQKKIANEEERNKRITKQTESNKMH